MQIRDYTIPKDYDIYKLWKPEQHFQRIDKYSVYLWDEGRLETWEEVVARATDTLRYISKEQCRDEEYQNIFNMIYTLEALPSMRLLSMPLEAVKRCNTVLYNCTYGLGDTFTAISEAQYLSMSGCGVSWSVERKNVDKLPRIAHLSGLIQTYTIEDSQEGWAKATKFLTDNLTIGIDVIFDYSQIRAEGTPLKTKGGYASGPNILIDTHHFIRETFRKAQGRKVTPLEMHDMFCYALESGISGGTRRSAGMCLFDFDNEEITTAKYDFFWEHPVHKVRANANNSAVWPDEVTEKDIEALTKQLFTTGTGEPGIFKRNNAIKTSPEWRNFVHPEYVGTNPCGEIYLQAAPVDSEYFKGGGWQFCNLSSVNARENETKSTLMEKTKQATLIGDIQSLATDFRFLREGTKAICDHDRLLGVNLIGYATCPLIRDEPEFVEDLRDLTVGFDLVFADKFGVNRSGALTSVKPSGNHSVFCLTPPGGNPIHGRRQIRNVTVNRNSAMHIFLENQGVPRNDYPGRDYASMFAFPIAYPDNSVTLEECGAIDQLEIWAYHKKHWTHHNPSVTIAYEMSEIPAIKDWLFKNQDIIGGLALSPKYESSYELLPIVVVSKEKYDSFIAGYPVIKWDSYRKYEKATDERQQVAECAGGVCAIQW